MECSGTAEPPAARVAHVHAPEEENRHATHPIRFALAGVAALLVILAAFTAWYELGHDGRVFHGVGVLGKDISGMSREQALSALTQASAGYPSSNLTVSGGGKTWNLTAADLGVEVNVDETLNAAMGVGRDGGLLENAGTQLGALFGGRQLAPLLKHDASMIDKVVARIAADLDKPAVDSKLEKGADGLVSITPSSSGTQVDRQALGAALTSSSASIPFQAVGLVTKEIAPKVTEAALNGAKAQALLLTEQPIVLKAGGQSWALQPNDLRDMLVLDQASDGAARASLDNNRLAAYLKTIADQIHIEPANATLAIGRGTVTLAKDKSGAELDAVAALAAIEEAATKGDATSRVVALSLKEIPAAVRKADLQPLYDKVNSLVTQGIRFHTTNDGYTIKGPSVTSFLDIAPKPDTSQLVKLVIDDSALSAQMAGVASVINTEPLDAQYAMLNNAPAKVADAKNGVAVDVKQSVRNARQAIEGYTGGDKLQVDLVATAKEPAVKDIAVDNIQTPDLLAYGQTSYAISSPERAWNVGFGAGKINGTLVPPGATFSTVNTIGPLTLDAGFKMGYAIEGDGKGGLRTVPAEAGGICQVSTTLFHAVFRAGLQMVERNWHSYWIGLYGLPPTGLLGLDATIAPPYKDFRWKNTSGNWILIKSTADGKNVRFELWGVNPHWTVSVGDPVITNRVKTTQDKITESSDRLPKGVGPILVEHAQDGFDASITRVVTDAGGNVIDNWVAKSHYQPAHNRYLVGTGQSNGSARP